MKWMGVFIDYKIILTICELVQWGSALWSAMHAFKYSRRSFAPMCPFISLVLVYNKLRLLLVMGHQQTQLTNSVNHISTRNCRSEKGRLWIPAQRRQAPQHNPFLPLSAPHFLVILPLPLLLLHPSVIFFFRLLLSLTSTATSWPFHDVVEAAFLSRIQRTSGRWIRGKALTPSTRAH